jgi:hypothetical protein
LAEGGAIVDASARGLSSMSNLEEFKQTIGALRKQDESDNLDKLALSLGTWDSDLNQHEQDQAREQLLEAHTRLVMIDALFTSLGWKLNPGPQICFGEVTAYTEVPVSPSGVRRWMDYLGFERVGATIRPRLMVEAKRYRLSLPIIDRHSPPERHPFRDKIREFAYGESPTGVTKEWLNYLEDHFDYLRGLEKQNGRVAVSAITNGAWLIVISDPHQLLSAKTADNAEILCFESLEKIQLNAELAYQRMSRLQLCPGADLVSIEDVSNILNPSNVYGLSYASVVTYSQSQAPYKQVPRVSIAPLIALIGTNNSITFCRCDSDHVYDTPPLNTVRQIVEAEQSRLAQRLRERFAVDWQVLSVNELVTKIGNIKFEAKRSDSSEREWRFLTGNRPWIFEETAATGCIAHHLQAAEEWHCAELGRQPSVSPRTMFHAGHSSQCRHIDLKDKRHRKSLPPIGGTGITQPPLCWVYDLEQYGCCQNCLFLSLCPATRSAQLPCGREGLVMPSIG